MEGHHDKEGRSVVYTHGTPLGSMEEMARQIIYLHERIVADCARRGRAPAVTTIVNAQSPSFRTPDSNVKAAAKLASSMFPWSAQGRILFVGVAKHMRPFFKIAAAMTKQEIRIVSREELHEFVDEKHIPAALGGKAEWNMDRYIERRRLKELAFV